MHGSHLTRVIDHLRERMAVNGRFWTASRVLKNDTISKSERGHVGFLPRIDRDFPWHAPTVELAPYMYSLLKLESKASCKVLCSNTSENDDLLRWATTMVRHQLLSNENDPHPGEVFVSFKSSGALCAQPCSPPSQLAAFGRSPPHRLALGKCSFWVIGAGSVLFSI